MAEDDSSRASAVRTMFAAIAHRYDFLNHFLSMRRDIAWRRATVRKLLDLLPPGAVIADVCCGTGDLAIAMRRAMPGTVLGVDFCYPMLRLARQKISRAEPELHWVAADALALPMATGSLDAVTIAFGLRNLVEIPAGLREMQRVLKPGGWVAILEFSRVQGPVFSKLFAVYFRHILPRLGTWISGVKGPYQYLEDSVSRFPDQGSLAAALREAGFKNVSYQNFSGGVAALHLGQKAG